MPEVAGRLIESVPNVSEGRRLDVVERLAAAITTVRGVHLLDRTSDASHNRSVFTLAGERRAGQPTRSSARSRPRSTRSTWTPTPASTRASARSTSSRSCRSATRRWTTASSWRGAFGERIAAPLRAAGLPLRGRRAPARPGQARRRPARPVRGPQGGDRPARPRARLRTGPDAPLGRCRGGRRAAVPDRLQHQPRARTTSSSPSGSPGASASRAAACPRSRRTASGSRSSSGDARRAPRCR